MSPFTGNQGDPVTRGRGRTLEKAMDNAVERAVAANELHHGDEKVVTITIIVSNPHVGEYIVDLS